jgi:SulP family sulfate permease
LTSRALEKIVQTRYDANQELIGQGISNICCGLFGALPVTSLIVQSTMNYMSGAQSRLSSMFAAATIAASALVIYPFIAYIPIPALIGSLLSVAWRMMSSGVVEMRKLRRMCIPSFGVYTLSGSAVMSVGVTQV